MPKAWGWRFEVGFYIGVTHGVTLALRGVVEAVEVFEASAHRQGSLQRIELSSRVTEMRTLTMLIVRSITIHLNCLKAEVYSKGYL